MESPSPGNDPSRNDDPRSGAAAADFGGIIFAVLIVLCILKMLGT